MDAVTYPDPNVVTFIQERIIPLKVAHDAKPLSEDFNVKWTPTLVTLDHDGKEHHRTIGFLSPNEFIASLMLGMAKCDFDLGRLDHAVSLFEELLMKHPKSRSAPEATYLLGVSRYKITHEARHLKEAYERLLREYPSSEWTERASPYRLL